MGGLGGLKGMGVLEGYQGKRKFGVERAGRHEGWRTGGHDERVGRRAARLLHNELW